MAIFDRSNESTDANQAQPALRPDELQRLAQWYEVDLDDPNPLVAAGAARNTLRAAEGFGPRLVLMLAEEGFLTETVNPLGALRDLIDRFRQLGGKDEEERGYELIQKARIDR